MREPAHALEYVRPFHVLVAGELETPESLQARQPDGHISVDVYRFGVAMPLPREFEYWRDVEYESTLDPHPWFEKGHL